MKTKVTTSEVEFQPVTITLTIENPDELYDLWHRTNVSFGSIKAAYQGGEVGYPPFPKEVANNVYTLWKVLDDIAYSITGSQTKKLRRKANDDVYV